MVEEMKKTEEMDIEKVIERVSELKTLPEEFFKNENPKKQLLLNQFKDALALNFGGENSKGEYILDGEYSGLQFPEQLEYLELAHKLLKEELEKIEE